MALDAANRAWIYEKLRPVLGDEDANVLMSEFPSIEVQELVPKDLLRAELAGVEGRLRGEIADVDSKLTMRLGWAIAATTAVIPAAVGS